MSDPVIDKCKQVSKRIVVLLSGGLDSATLAYHAQATEELAACVFVDYDQPAVEHEKVAATTIAEQLDVPLYFFRVDNFFAEPMHAAPGTGGPRVVPARNALLLSLAANAAAECGGDAVWLGAIKDDAESYADCGVGFIGTMSSVIHTAVGVRVAAPFIRESKAAIVSYARTYQVPIMTTWSCYAPRNGAPCRGCDACLQREAALRVAVL